MNFSEHLAEHGVVGLFYLTSFKNLESILERGILCRQSAKKYQSDDISLEDVQRLRKAYHSKVPLFFASNTPMLYHVCTKDGRNYDVVMLEISPDVANRAGVSFFDENAAASDANKYTDPSDLHKLDWHVIHSPAPAWGTDRHGRNWKGARSAEIHIPDVCPASYLRKIYFQSNLVDGRSKLSKIIADSPQSHEILLTDSLTPTGIRSN